MKSITIPGNKRTEPKTFAVGEHYIVTISDWIEAFVKCIEIDKRIIFEDVINKKIYRSPITQFDRKTSTADNILDLDDHFRHVVVKEACTLSGYFSNYK